MFVCMFVCLYVCLYACMYVCIYLRTYVCVYVCVYNYACMHACMYVREGASGVNSGFLGCALVLERVHDLHRALFRQVCAVAVGSCKAYTAVIRLPVCGWVREGLRGLYRTDGCTRISTGFNKVFQGSSQQDLCPRPPFFS